MLMEGRFAGIALPPSLIGRDDFFWADHMLGLNALLPVSIDFSRRVKISRAGGAGNRTVINPRFLCMNGERAAIPPPNAVLTKMTQTGTEPREGNMTIDFKNLIVGRHESKVLFIWNLGRGVAVLGAFRGIKDGIEAILARDGITPAQRAILEEFRAIAGKNNWDFATLRESLL